MRMMGLARSATRSTVSSYTSRWTKTRLPATHVWPPAAKMPATTPMDAEAMSASGNTMFGDLPPNSSVALTNRSAVAIVVGWRLQPKSHTRAGGGAAGDGRPAAPPACGLLLFERLSGCASRRSRRRWLR
jgi:hypothetical protein